MKIDNYANSIAEVMKNAVESAFWSGFQYAQSLNLNDEEFVDLGLPSGTKWGKNYLGVTEVSKIGDYFSFIESIKYSLPTEEQVNELRDYCTFVPYDGDKGYIILGPNGNRLILGRNFLWNNTTNGTDWLSQGYYLYSNNAFWIRSNDANTPKICTIVEKDKKISIEIVCAKASLYKHQILLIKKDNH